MIAQSITTALKMSLLKKGVDFSAPVGDVFKMALYTSAANLGPDTLEYTPIGEVVGPGYSAGGRTLVNKGVGTGLGVGGQQVTFTSFEDLTWLNATFVVRGAMIYDTTENNKACFILDFGTDKSPVNCPFTVEFPAFSALSALFILD